MEIVIGKIIKEITEQRGISKSELGRRLNMSPTNVHKIFKRETIDTGLLYNLSQVLAYDFFAHYTFGPSYEMKGDIVTTASESEAVYKKELDLSREKIQMLEKINMLLEEKIEHLKK